MFMRGSGFCLLKKIPYIFYVRFNQFSSNSVMFRSPMATPRLKHRFSSNLSFIRNIKQAVSYGWFVLR